jgi:hypothetical protein
MHFTELPDTALAAILSGFCDGKTISTLALNVVSNRSGHCRFWNICRNVLVERYIRLSRHGSLLSSSSSSAYEEIRDVLDITREDIRLSTNDDDDDDMITKFSHWCAILDYFETQLHLFQIAAAAQSQQQQQQQSNQPSSSTSSSSPMLLPRRREPQWIVWRGNMTMPNGEIQCYLTTPFWSVGAMRFWQQMEQENASFCRPSPPNFAFRPPRSRRTAQTSTDASAAAESEQDDADDDDDTDTDDSFDLRRPNGITPYGTLFAIDPVSKRRFAFQCGDLAIDHFDDVRERDHWRHALIPLSQLYENEPPTVVLVDHSFVSRTYTEHPVGPLLVGKARSSLCVCWDKEQGEDDWESSHARLGEMCVQIMNGFPGRTFRDGLLANSTDYVYANEFCNF